MKYKSKPEIIDAVQWFSGIKHPNVEQTEECLQLKEGMFYLDPESDLFDAEIIYNGDYIITNSDGSISVMSEEEFNKKYERLVNKCPHCKNGQIKFSVKFSDTVETAVCSTCKGTGEIEN